MINNVFVVTHFLSIIYLSVGFLLLVTTPIVVSVVVSIIATVRNNKIKQFVLSNSEALKAVKEINNKYTWTNVSIIDFRHSYDNLDFFEEISCEDYLIYMINENKQPFYNRLREMDTALDTFEEYRKAINDSHIKYGIFGNKTINVKEEKLLRMEEQIVKKSIKSGPSSIIAEVTLHKVDSYETIFKTKHGLFKYNEVEALIDRINNKSGFFYNDEEIWKSLCRVERGKVSNALRFKIYERDHNKCRRCGATTHLTIDHIRPISKGGKSEPSNLQTLCESCNKAKGNDY